MIDARKTTLAALLLTMAYAPLAQAQGIGGGGDVAGILQNVATYLEGPMLTAIAIIAIIAVGIGMAASRRFEMMHIGMVVGGLALAFSAATMVTTLRG